MAIVFGGKKKRKGWARCVYGCDAEWAHAE